MSKQREIVTQILFSASNMQSNTERVGKQGYLFKRTGTVHHIWKKRFFVLDRGMLFEKKVRYK